MLFSSSCIRHPLQAVVLVVLLVALDAVADRPSWPVNGDFEQGKLGWTLFSVENESGRISFETADDFPHSGRLAACLKSDSMARYGLLTDALKVAPGERYRISTWVRAALDAKLATDGAGPVIRLTFQQSGKAAGASDVHYYAGLNQWLGRRPNSSSGAEFPRSWSRIEAVVEIPRDVSYLGLRLYAWKMQGTLYFDQVEVTQVTAETPLTPLAHFSEPAQPLLPEIESHRIAEIAGWLSERPIHFAPPIENRVFWEPLNALPSAPALLAAADHYAGIRRPELTEAMHGEFKRSGERLLFDDTIKERGNRLAVFALAEGLKNDGELLPLIESEIDALLNMPSWALSAHTPERKTWAAARDFVDLSAAAHAWILASVDWMLGDKLKPATRRRIRHETDERVFVPYLRRVRSRDRMDFWWMTRNHNWNAVCHAGVMGSALLLKNDVLERAEFIAAWEVYSRDFLAGFSADGFCHEGINYWAYGFGHYILASEAIRLSTGQRIDPMADSRMSTIATFGRNWEITDGAYPYFSDVGVGNYPPNWLDSFAALRCNSGGPVYPPTFEQRSLLSPQQLYSTLYDLSLPREVAGNPVASASKAAFRPLRNWFPEGGALITRRASSSEGIAVALKGGNNAQPHNHNDLGSFVVVNNGRIVLNELGRDDYVHDTFGSTRYNSGVMNSFGHPVPLVAGQLQRTGSSARALTIRTEFSETRDLWMMDLTSAYDVPGLIKLTRTFVFSRDAGGRLEVLDHVVFSTQQNFGSAIILLPDQRCEQIGDNRYRVAAGGHAVFIEASAEGGEIIVHEQPVMGIVPGKAPKGMRIGFDLASPAREASIRLVITPASPSDSLGQ